jgi:Major royal jelly protein
VIFFGEMQKNAVSCWHIKEPFKASNVHILEQNNSTLIYPVDLEVKVNNVLKIIFNYPTIFQIDNESTLWVLSNRLPRFIYERYDTNEYNFNIFKGNTDAVLAGTSCLG